MTKLADESLRMGPPPAALKRIALKLALSTLSDSDAAINDLLAAAARGERSLDGLFAAWREEHVAAALWTETQAGHGADLWPPRLRENAPPVLAAEILNVALRELEAQQVTLVQSLLIPGAADDAERLARAGFEHPCDLLFLLSDQRHFPSSPIATHLTFTPFEPAHLARLTRIVEATYQGSLDCPAIDRRRDCRDAVDGYRATCRNDVSNWLIVGSGDDDVGCLLLGRDSRQESWELVYMGLVPGMRGRGCGLDLVRYAQWLVARQAGQRLLAAVDAANEPALKTYNAAGFVVWNTRNVYLKFLPSDPEVTASH